MTTTHETTETQESGTLVSKFRKPSASLNGGGGCDEYNMHPPRLFPWGVVEFADGRTEEIHFGKEADFDTLNAGDPVTVSRREEGISFVLPASPAL